MCGSGWRPFDSSCRKDIILMIIYSLHRCKPIANKQNIISHHIAWIIIFSFWNFQSRMLAALVHRWFTVAWTSLHSDGVNSLGPRSNKFQLILSQQRIAFTPIVSSSCASIEQRKNETKTVESPVKREVSESQNIIMSNWLSYMFAYSWSCCRCRLP